MSRRRPPAAEGSCIAPPLTSRCASHQCTHNIVLLASRRSFQWRGERELSMVTYPFSIVTLATHCARVRVIPSHTPLLLDDSSGVVSAFECGNGDKKTSPGHRSTVESAMAYCPMSGSSRGRHFGRYHPPSCFLLDDQLRGWYQAKNSNRW